MAATGRAEWLSGKFYQSAVDAEEREVAAVEGWILGVA
jgi:hypothetical protein